MNYQYWNTTDDIISFIYTYIYRIYIVQVHGDMIKKVLSTWQSRCIYCTKQMIENEISNAINIQWVQRNMALKPISNPVV